MKYPLSATGKKRLALADPSLIVLINALCEIVDITVLCTHRGEAEQNEAFKNGKSKLKFPNSKHNCLPSRAIDIAPYPIDWNNIDRFNEMLDIVQKLADERGIKIRLGRSFSFKDFPHIELV